MSIQAECREALTRLADQGVVFTEIDVTNEARSAGWSSTHLERALKDSQRICAAEYKKGELVRYGPVNFKGHMDYGRKGSKIVYASATAGPAMWETPNGQFPRLFSAKDEMARAGRKVGTDRDDTKPWSMQSPLKRVEETKGPPIDPKPFLKRIQELEAEVKRLTTENSNGNGKVAPVVERVEAEHEPVTVAVTELADLLEDQLCKRLEERLDERIRERFAEKLIA